MKVFIISLLFYYVHYGESMPNETQFKRFRPDYHYNELAGGWVKFHHVPTTWLEARLRCYLEGAVLASPVNENMKQGLIELLVDQLESKVFTGIHSIFSKGDFTSVEGIPVHEMPVNIRSGDISGECVTFMMDGRLEGHDCSSKYPYICHKRAPRDLTTSICGVDQEYKYDPRTGSCYKFHKFGRTWYQAASVCAAEGGHLAIINSDVEAEVIKGIYQNYPDDTIQADHKHTASIGFLDWGVRGLWWTIHGQDLTEAGYSKWNKGSPDDKTQYCGAVMRAGTLNDIWCEKQTFPAICEKTTEFSPRLITLR
ncbi:macrophage mannose receptor 1-like [Ostrinia nubilalis]|uniref:macrophage mannose receptor 1-like n=1 Tax=Ostrinia nubilalis TaxID=29057 RepID=UPI0030825E49